MSNLLLLLLCNTNIIHPKKHDCNLILSYVRPKDAMNKRESGFFIYLEKNAIKFLFLHENILFSHEEPKEEPQRKTKRNLG
jgi:hypothetical protein